LTQVGLINIQLVSDDLNTIYTDLPSGSTAEFLVDNDFSNPTPILQFNAGNSNWTAGTGSEYFYTVALDEEPEFVYENTAEMTQGTVGALAAGEWGWDSGNSYVYVRLADSSDPDTKAVGYVTYKYPNATYTPLFVFSNEFNETNSWYDTDTETYRNPVLTDGEIAFNISAKTENFYDRLSTSGEVSATTQVHLFDAVPNRFMIIEFDFYCKNVFLDDGAVTLDIATANVYTKAETDARYIQKADAAATPATELTIATGAVARTQWLHLVDTEGDAGSDDLDTISDGNEGDLLKLRLANAARIVTITNAGNITTSSGSSVVMAANTTYNLEHDGSGWIINDFLIAGGSVELADNLFRIVDNGDDTKKLAFECSGITTATTRTLTVPDRDLTLIGTGAATTDGTLSRFDSNGNLTDSLLIDNVGTGALTIVKSGTTARTLTLGDRAYNLSPVYSTDGTNVGVGGTPTAKLRVYGGIVSGSPVNNAVTSGISIKQSADSILSGVLLEESGGTSNGGIYLVGANLTFRSSGINAMQFNGAEVYVNGAGTPKLGVGTSGPDATLDASATTEQLRLTYTDGSVYTSFTTSSGGDLTIAPSGGDVNVTGTLTTTGTLTVGAYTLPATDGTLNYVLTTDGAGAVTWQAGSGAGDVVGPGSATDEAFARFDTGTGKLIQNSNITCTDAGAITVAGNFTLPTADGTLNQVLVTDGAGAVTWTTVAGTGDVVGPAGATDNAICRYNGATGTSIQDSGITIDDNDLLSGVAGVTLDAPTELTISGGVVTAVQGLHRIDTQADAASDDLDTITATYAGELKVRAENSARTVVLKHGTGNLELGGSDISLTDTDQFIILQYDSVLSKWVVAGDGGGGGGGATLDSIVRLHTANGHGSSSTKIRRFSTSVTDTGSDITYADSATLGATFTINADGVYAISYTDTFNGVSSLGVSLNSAQLTTNVSAITAADRLVLNTCAASDHAVTVATTINLSNTDVIRAHTDGGTTGATAAYATFTITRVG